MKICIASIATTNIKELAEITVANKIAYCEKRGYSGAFLTQVESFTGMDKMLFLEGLLNTSKYDYILLCDCDTLVTNFDKKVEDLLDDEHHFWIATDNNTFNAGVIIVRNSPEGREYVTFLREKMQSFKPEEITYRLGEEQTAILASYHDEKYNKLIKIHPQKIMNAYPYSDIRGHPNGYLDQLGVNGDWKPGDFIIHIAGFLPDFYEKMLYHFKEYEKKVIK